MYSTMEAPSGCCLGGSVTRLPGMLDGLLLRHGAKLPRGVEDEISHIKRDLEEIVIILSNHSNSEPHSTMAVSCWTKEVRELSYDMEDFIDEYEHDARSRPRRHTRRWRRSKSNTTPGAPYWLRERLRQRLWMANKIREFSMRAQEALRRHAVYNLGSGSSGATQPDASSFSTSWDPALYSHDDLLVGIDASMVKLEKWLVTMHDYEEHQKLRVVSIVGSGGVGKTTLANQLYRKLGRRFQCRAFVRISQKPDIRELFISMLSQLNPWHTPGDWTVPSLILSIRSYLQYRRYLIVLDGLWCTSTWDIIYCALPDGNSCSRILILTEVEDLAMHSSGYDSTYVLKMTPLGKDESRKLFFCSLFGPQCECPPELREVSYDIIRKCSGFPLAIVMVASVLACQKETKQQWDHVNKSLGCSLIMNPTREGMKQVLDLSYKDLPEHLKACILYMSIYQEDSIIWKDDLVNQWIAEGFVFASHGQDDQEIAGAYFDELVRRKLIQPVDVKDDCEVLSCVVHYMILDHIATQKSIEENFVTSIHYCQTSNILADKVRRLSLHFGNTEDAIPPANMRLSQVRTIAFFGTVKYVPSVVEFRLLQVLILHFWGDKDNISLDLTRIAELFRLKYLKITSNATLELKTQMQGLKNLETIKIDAKLSAIPQDITQLIGLLHLSLPSETDLPSGISHITSLRSLGHCDIISNSIENIQSLSKLSNLRYLQLTCSSMQPDYLKYKIQLLLSSIHERLSNLKSLTLLPTAYYANSLDRYGATGITVSSNIINNSFTTLTHLHRLEFSPHICIFSCLPMCIGLLKKLCILKIGIGKMVRSSVDVLKGLPALSVLSLYVHYKPAEMIVIGKAGFPVLKYLMFKCCDPMLQFDTDAMPNLQKLVLGFNYRRAERVKIPVGIEHLSGLKELHAKVGGNYYEEHRRWAAESAFANAMRAYVKCARVIVKYVDYTFGSEEDQSGVLQEERATLQQCKVEVISNQYNHNQIVEDPVNQAVEIEHADNRLMLSEWNMLLLLRNKLDNQNDDITSGIPVVGHDSMDPWKLLGISMGTGEPLFYFCPLQEGSKDSPAPSGEPHRFMQFLKEFRTVPTPSGYWRETGSADYIYSAKRIPIGMKKTLEFYHGREPSAERTTWKMKEFTALREATAGSVHSHLMERCEMSLCHLYIEHNTNAAGYDAGYTAGLMQMESCRVLQSGVERNTKKDAAISVRQRQRTVTTRTCVDGFSWRKFGQKQILNAKYPRGYYSCMYRLSMGCRAMKHVQRTDGDPSVYRVTYRNEHTCQNTDQSSGRPATGASGDMTSVLTGRPLDQTNLSLVSCGENSDSAAESRSSSLSEVTEVDDDPCIWVIQDFDIDGQT